MAEQMNVESLTGLGVAAIMARKGHDAVSVGAALGADLPDGAKVVRKGDLAILGTGPGTWLAIMPNALPDFAEGLGGKLHGVASVSDQSSGYAITRLSGPGARTALQRGVAIDLHPDYFPVGTAASTVIAHIGVIVWQVDDAPTYDIATFRSYASSFRHWLDQVAAAL
ncbi:sarcosine oxidase subunit gamma [Croceicoccus bisphenolivorans]|uniref:sarcosine oxidase subunit gamma n=1 Tax=Croceicoccus bisphenolivorans TaxID=1783232 RepID=UPI00083636F3|nr:sarcosine oxidase subunit gamma family protein [Croceicoccus bisphenolivorans]